MEKVILITGASSGFGQATADLLSSKEFRVYGTSRKGVPEARPPYSILKMDVCDQPSVRQAVAAVLEREGRIDVVVNNAGISTISPLEETPLDEVDQLMDTNVYGVLRVCQAVLPAMRRQKAGLIINIGSIGGLMGLPYRGIYAAGKFALEGLTESLSMEVKPFGIVACLVEPGDFKTSIDRNRRIIGLPPESVYKTKVDGLVRTVSLQMQKAPSPEPVAEMIHTIINSPNPRLRYKVGSFAEKSAVILKTLLPGRLFEKILMGFYRTQ